MEDCGKLSHSTTESVNPQRPIFDPDDGAGRSFEEDKPIVLTGVSASPLWPFTESKDLKNRRVMADVMKNAGGSLAQAAVVYDGDAYDASFEVRYPDHEWVSESTLHFWQKDEAENQRAIPSEIILLNELRQSLKYALCSCRQYEPFSHFTGNSGTPVQCQ